MRFLIRSEITALRSSIFSRTASVRDAISSRRSSTFSLIASVWEAIASRRSSMIAFCSSRCSCIWACFSAFCSLSSSSFSWRICAGVRESSSSCAEAIEATPLNTKKATKPINKLVIKVFVIDESRFSKKARGFFTSICTYSIAGRRQRRLPAIHTNYLLNLNLKNS